MIPRAYKRAGLILLCFSLYVFGRCSGKSEGKDSVRDKELKAQISSLEKQSSAEKKRADKERSRADSLLRAVKVADSVVKIRGSSLNKATQKYETLRDSIKHLPETPNSTLSLIAAADSALSKAQSVIQAHEAKDVLQDSALAYRTSETLALRNVVGMREQEIRALNERMSIASRRIGRARREGFIVGVGVAAFVAVTIKGMQ